MPVAQVDCGSHLARTAGLSVTSVSVVPARPLDIMCARWAFYNDGLGVHLVIEAAFLGDHTHRKELFS